MAAAISLPDCLQVMYTLNDMATPHVTLKVANGGEAKTLGSMIKRSLAMNWTPTRQKNLLYSPSTETYMIAQSSCFCILKNASFPTAESTTKDCARCKSNHKTIVHTTRGVKTFIDSSSFTLSAHRLQGLPQILNTPYSTNGRINSNP